MEEVRGRERREEDRPSPEEEKKKVRRMNASVSKHQDHRSIKLIDGSHTEGSIR